VDTYAPGAKKKEWKNFAQIFIPIDDQNISNGGLKIIPKSHKQGILPFDDFVNSNFSHKRKVKLKALDVLYKKYGVIDLDLKAGDILIFNHLVVHSSPKNMTPKERISLVLQAQSASFRKNNQIFKNATNYRRKFTIDILKSKLNNLKGVNMYKDFNKK
jgi:ectoine hydroxylase-related dioxygenase (phytanoyl-CoA dioxygenase family)